MRLLVLICLILVSGYKSEEISTYTAAVVEVNAIAAGYNIENVKKVTKQVTEIIESNELNGVDIVVLPEGILNEPNTAVLLTNPNNTYCNDANAHFVLRDISCAVRNANRYVAINLYAKVNCSEDDQKFCANEIDNTNLYNMAIIFDRNGDVVAKYRKYHLFGEGGVQQTEKPDFITFETDFNVTFGVCICFDLMFSEPANDLVQQGVKNFVYPTYWYSELPYLTSAQYQNSWAYANNVNLLAANQNIPVVQCSGSGIYSGRSGALKVFVSETAATKILIANVPVDLPANDDVLSTFESDEVGKEMKLDTRSVYYSEENKGMQYISNMNQDNLTEFSVKFLNFHKSNSQAGTVCNNGICCYYNIEVTDKGEQEGNTSYSYAISVFSGYRHYKSIKNLLTGQEVCSLIACTEMNSKDSCGLRLPVSQIHNRFNFKKLDLRTVLPITHMKTMPNTLTQELLPLKSTEFEHQISKVEGDAKYSVTLNLTEPKDDILTFAIFSRDYDKDIIGQI
ncbi:vanin-like protein 2 [Contarinia nasturtii]|uniref:vanin-like protein 2 n=1 Tax=Contarinia nasturtii TaxID=265458 RepID=UPI0012D3B5B9|nr:vanin-like protein 2 [Contarinia nasturtii]